jgi:hypothetical protein
MRAVSLYLDVYLKDGGGNVEHRSRNIESRNMADGQDARATEGGRSGYEACSLSRRCVF